ncbi:MAG: DUF1190 domain-containing protein [Hyphomicrobiaceae bacterium]
MRRVPRSAAIAAALVAALLTSACGKGTGKAAAKGDRIVYATLDDCVDAGKLQPAECDTVFEAAVGQHEQTAITYRTLSDCEKAEGIERCERTTTGAYKPRPSAFLVTFTPKPTAEAMYLALKKANAYRTAKGTVIKPDGDTPFSDRARDRLSDLREKKSRRG